MNARVRESGIKQRISTVRWRLLSVFWLLLVFGSFIWNYRVFTGNTTHLALSEARSQYSQDLLYRRWASKQGGVYVPPSADTPPNPYLTMPDRDVVTTGGKKLTLINPAYMVRQVHELATKQGEGSFSHLTSLRPLRPENAPDPWEAETLRKFETGLKEYSATETMNGQPYLRFMGAMLVEKPCLKCHEKQGYKEGDVRGGISVSVPLKKFEYIENEHRRSLVYWHSAICLIGLLGIGFARRRIERIEEAQIKAEIQSARYADRHALMENMGEGVYGIDSSGACTVINQAALRLLGYREDEVIGRNAHALFHHHHPDGTPFPPEECAAHQALSTGARHEGETWFFRKSGELFPVSFIATPVDTRLENQGASVVVSFQDITARKLAEERTQALLRRNQLLMDSALEGIFILNDQGQLLEANRSFCQMLGYTADELQHRHCADWEAGHTPDELPTMLQALLHSESVFETRYRCKDSKIIDMEVSAVGIQLEGKPCLYVSCREITDRKRAEDEIRHLAFYDTLTGLPNRRLATDRMEQILALARRNGDLVAVCMIDLDGFKQVNDQKGHKAGDQLLIEVAKRLQECIRQSDTASRFGGDEFALILGEFRDIGECEQLLGRIIASLGSAYTVMGEVVHVTASIGATIFPNDGGTPDLLLRHADQAMYEAKQAGKNCFRLFNPSLHNQQLSNQAIIKKIAQALDEGQLVLHYQPQVNCRKGKVVGMEALIRWQHPILGLLAPSEFIPLLEHDDLIIAVGEWSIRQALEQLSRWRDAGYAFGIGVNISARQLHQHNFAQRLAELTAAYPQEIVHRLELEILETAALEDIDTVAEAIRQCRALGIHVAIDDFGTGFSSLAHLKHLQVDALKIDRSFVDGMLRNAGDLAIVSGVIGLAASFRHTVIAEGVETIDHVLMLAELGCNRMQGFGIARPMPAEQINDWLSHFEPDPLWQLSASSRPSREYFELLLAEANHRHWVEQQLHRLSDPDSPHDPHALDTQACRFGDWYYGEGMRQFGQTEWFQSLEAAHAKIHRLAAELALLKRKNLPDTDSATTELSMLQNQFDHQLSTLRNSLAGSYLAAAGVPARKDTQ